jgi:predicted transcriptional regulator
MLMTNLFYQCQLNIKMNTSVTMTYSVLFPSPLLWSKCLNTFFLPWLMFTGNMQSKPEQTRGLQNLFPVFILKKLVYKGCTFITFFITGVNMNINLCNKLLQKSCQCKKYFNLLLFIVTENAY